MEEVRWYNWTPFEMCWATSLNCCPFHWYTFHWAERNDYFAWRMKCDINNGTFVGALSGNEAKVVYFFIVLSCIFALSASSVAIVVLRRSFHAVQAQVRAQDTLIKELLQRLLNCILVNDNGTRHIWLLTWPPPSKPCILNPYTSSGQYSSRSFCTAVNAMWTLAQYLLKFVIA